MSASDRELGLDRPITRRDFLNGIGVAVGGALTAGLPRALSAADAGSAEASGAAAPPGPGDPPSLTGLRGDHPGSFETAHALRDGASWPAAETGERYDLVVVGAGLSGLSAAWYFRREAGAGARMLLLDPHDDFGGHAKRNEFRHGDRLVIGYGGSQSLDTPSSFTAGARALLDGVGVDLEAFRQAFDAKLYESRGLKRAVFFDRETFGSDRLAVGEPMGEGEDLRSRWSEFLGQSPLPEAARRDILRIHEETGDCLAGLTPEQKRERLRSWSYRDYLLRGLKVHPLAAAYFQARAHDDIALGADCVSAWWCFLHGRPGFGGLGLEPPEDPRRGEPYIFHFPDGNAGVARLIVRSLIPAALASRGMADSVLGRVDYGALDKPAAPVRLRLGSTVVRVRNRGRGVEAVYVRGGRAWRVEADACVLACDNAMIPHLCPGLPEGQKRALKLAVRAPLVHTNVLLRDSTALQSLGVREIHSPGGYHAEMSLDFPVSLGAYRFPSEPREPCLLHLIRAPLKPGLPAREQFRAGRAGLLAEDFESIERRTRDQLARALSAGGFDPARDIEAITVNRWPHGYSMGQNSLYDPDWPEEDAPWVLGRKRFGRIAIANSDAAGIPLAQAALDQAARAVDELVERRFPYSDRL